MTMLAQAALLVLLSVMMAVSVLALLAMRRNRREGLGLRALSDHALAGTVGVFCTLAASGALMIMMNLVYRGELGGLVQMVERRLDDIAAGEPRVQPGRGAVVNAPDCLRPPTGSVIPERSVMITGEMTEAERVRLRSLFVASAGACGGGTPPAGGVRIELTTLPDLIPNLFAVRAMVHVDGGTGEPAPRYLFEAAGRGSEPETARLRAILAAAQKM